MLVKPRRHTVPSSHAVAPCRHNVPSHHAVTPCRHVTAVPSHDAVTPCACQVLGEQLRSTKDGGFLYKTRQKTKKRLTGIDKDTLPGGGGDEQGADNSIVSRLASLEEEPAKPGGRRDVAPVVGTTDPLAIHRRVLLGKSPTRRSLASRMSRSISSAFGLGSSRAPAGDPALSA